MSRYPEPPADPVDFLDAVDALLAQDFGAPPDLFVPVTDEEEARLAAIDDTLTVGVHPETPLLERALALTAELASAGMGGMGQPGEWLRPDQERVQVAHFPVIGATFATGKMGVLRLTLAIEREFKYNAMPVTDWAGVQLECVFTRAALPGEVTDVPEASDAA